MILTIHKNQIRVKSSDEADTWFMGVDILHDSIQFSNRVMISNNRYGCGFFTTSIKSVYSFG